MVALSTDFLAAILVAGRARFKVVFIGFNHSSLAFTEMNDENILSRIEASDNAQNADFFGRNAIVVFARAPVIGQTKSRLARKIGDTKAALIYAAMLRDCLQLAQNAAAKEAGVLICHTPPNAFDFEFHGNPGSLSNFWSGARKAQSEGDLAARLLDCFSYLKECGAQKILVIGSDAPDIPIEYLQKAFMLLDVHELVFGPAEDGGFYLIGARQISPLLFENVLWSNRSTLTAILANAARHNCSTALLDSWRDVDEIEDLYALISRLKLAPDAAPHTRGVLRSENMFKR